MSKIKKEIILREGNKTKPETIISILRSIEVLMSQGKSLELACREAQIARQTYYRWRQEFGWMQVNASKELKKIKKENVRLKKIITVLSLDKEILQEVIEGKL